MAGTDPFATVSQSFGHLEITGDNNVIHQGIHINQQPQRAETPPLPSSTVPLLRDPDFVPRRALLQQIVDKVSAVEARVALVGLGGTGKTQLAVEYAAQVRQKSPDTWVIWIHASTAARVQQSVKYVAERAKIRGRNDPKADVLQLLQGWLSDVRKGKWLVILDNLDSVDVLTTLHADAEEKQGRLIEYFPLCEHGSVVITTRTEDVARRLVHETQIVTVPPMDAKHASVLLEKKLGVGEREDHHRLAAALDFLPLAMSQAAAYICEKKPRSSIPQYLHDIEASHRSRTSLLQRGVHLPDRDWEASNSIITTWQISFEHIYQTRRSAADLLSVMSLCDRQAIPEKLVRAVEDDHEPGATDDSFEDDITMLRGFSFISTTTRSTDWTMHRLVQDATRVWIERRGRLDVTQARFIRNLCIAFPSGDYENWQTCQELLPHVQCAREQRPTEKERLLDWASIMYRAAWYGWLVGDWDEAEIMADHSVRVRAEDLGKGNEGTIDSQAMLANILRSKGRWGEAEELEVEVLERTKAKLGVDHPDTLTSMANLASTYWNQGRWKEAEELDVEVLEATKAKLGVDHPDTLRSMANLASTYRNQGRWKEAEELQKNVVEGYKTSYGVQHPHTLTMVSNLAYMQRTRVQQSRSDLASQQRSHEIIRTSANPSISSSRKEFQQGNNTDTDVSEPKQR